MSGFANSILGGMSNLIRKAIRSPNYQTGVQGWSINQDGTAEFNSGTFRATVIVGPDGMPQVVISADGTHGYIRLPTNRPIEVIPAEIQSLIVNEGLPNENLRAGFFSPRLADNHGIGITLNSPAADGSATEFFAVSSTTQAGIIFVDRTSIAFNGNATLASGKHIVRGAMTPPTMTNGWGTFGGGFQAPRYIDYADGTAGLVGVTTGGTTAGGTTICTIPAALAPSASHTFDGQSVGGRHTQLVMDNAGALKIQNPDVGITWISLSQCRWPIAGVL